MPINRSNRAAPAPEIRDLQGTPVERARHATDAAVRAAWHARRPEPYAGDGITVERDIDDPQRPIST